MPTIQISKKLKKLAVSELVGKIYHITKTSKDGMFTIEKLSEILKPIKNEKNAILVLYIIYTILKTDNLSPKELFPKPKHGIELSNPYTKQLYGIYHVHLRDNYVLVL